jgi:1-deoxy-D-xylulose-5-phosphate reductoisomerase
MSSPRSADGRPNGAGRRQADAPDRRRVAVLGSTGSIGSQALDVLAAHPDLFEVTALAAGRNRARLEEQVARHRPRASVLVGDDLGRLEELATMDDVDLVVVATGGIVSLRPVLAALAAGKVVATANKETLVAGGHLVMPAARARAGEVSARHPADPLASPLAWLRPIDSEHSAIWQCLVGEPMNRIASLILTASGGPFLDGPAALSTVTPAQALRHPTWSMGNKITIDSATLANKGLEVVEARWLYDVDDAAIDVVVHPQSVVHSAVRFVDGSLKAQLGTPDMRTPIQYALTYPDRRPSPSAAVDLVAVGRLDFRAPDLARFPALRIAREAGRIGQRATTALIAADDVAVSRFLDGSLRFDEIPTLLEAAIARFGEGADQSPDLESVIALDAEVRAAFATGAVRTAGAAG